MVQYHGEAVSGVGWGARLKHLVSYHWLTILLAALLTLLFCAVMFAATRPVLPDEEVLRIQMAVPQADVTRLDACQDEWAEALGLSEVRIDYQPVNPLNPGADSWSAFMTDVMVGQGDVMLIPLSKVPELASMDVLTDLTPYFEDGSLTLPETDGVEADNSLLETHVYAVRAGNIAQVAARLGIDPGQGGAELVYCIPGYSRNVPAALAWINQNQ